MDAYIYKADLYCVTCAEGFMSHLADKAGEEDSDSYPQGPYSNGGGEADFPCHCGKCSVFLENPLTPDGYNYVRSTLRVNGEAGVYSPVVALWADFYGISEES
jgi:hypothetical protein